MDSEMDDGQLLDAIHAATVTSRKLMADHRRMLSRIEGLQQKDVARSGVPAVDLDSLRRSAAELERVRLTINRLQEIRAGLSELHSAKGFAELHSGLTEIDLGKATEEDLQRVQAAAAAVAVQPQGVATASALLAAARERARNVPIRIEEIDSTSNSAVNGAGSGAFVDEDDVDDEGSVRVYSSATSGGEQTPSGAILATAPPWDDDDNEATTGNSGMNVVVDEPLPRVKEASGKSRKATVPAAASDASAAPPPSATTAEESMSNRDEKEATGSGESSIDEELLLIQQQAFANRRQTQEEKKRRQQEEEAAKRQEQQELQDQLQTQNHQSEKEKAEAAAIVASAAVAAAAKSASSTSRERRRPTSTPATTQNEASTGASAVGKAASSSSTSASTVSMAKKGRNVAASLSSSAKHLTVSAGGALGNSNAHSSAAPAAAMHRRADGRREVPRSQLQHQKEAHDAAAGAKLLDATSKSVPGHHPAHWPGVSSHHAVGVSAATAGSVPAHQISNRHQQLTAAAGSKGPLPAVPAASTSGVTAAAAAAATANSNGQELDDLRAFCASLMEQINELETVRGRVVSLRQKLDRAESPPPIDAAANAAVASSSSANLMVHAAKRPLGASTTTVYDDDGGTAAENDEDEYAENGDEAAFTAATLEDSTRADAFSQRYPYGSGGALNVNALGQASKTDALSSVSHLLSTQQEQLLKQRRQMESMQRDILWFRQQQQELQQLQYNNHLMQASPGQATEYASGADSSLYPTYYRNGADYGSYFDEFNAVPALDIAPGYSPAPSSLMPAVMPYGAPGSPFSSTSPEQQQPAYTAPPHYPRPGSSQPSPSGHVYQGSYHSPPSVSTNTESFYPASSVSVGGHGSGIVAVNSESAERQRHAPPRISHSRLDNQLQDLRRYPDIVLKNNASAELQHWRHRRLQLRRQRQKEERDQELHDAHQTYQWSPALKKPSSTRLPPLASGSASSARPHDLTIATTPLPRPRHPPKRARSLSNSSSSVLPVSLRPAAPLPWHVSVERRQRAIAKGQQALLHTQRQLEETRRDQARLKRALAFGQNLPDESARLRFYRDFFAFHLGKLGVTSENSELEENNNDDDDNDDAVNDDTEGFDAIGEAQYQKSVNNYDTTLYIRAQKKHQAKFRGPYETWASQDQ